MDTKEYEGLQKLIERDYFLIKKGRWWSFLGGMLCFFVVAGFVSYKASLSAVESTSAKAASDSIARLKSKAEDDVSFISNLRESYSKDLEYLKSEVKFGGMYQVVDHPTDKRSDRVNPITNALKCPEGFNPYVVGRVIAAEPHWGATQFVCINR